MTIVKSIDGSSKLQVEHSTLLNVKINGVLYNIKEVENVITYSGAGHNSASVWEIVD